MDSSEKAAQDVYSQPEVHEKGHPFLHDTWGRTTFTEEAAVASVVAHMLVPSPLTE